ncbi:MAG: hypothetical protein K2M08_07835 [Anaeroplasmataceae bacterium]|nr:hypothetical protein [Anaeroplasmataceae bacterium]
MARYRGYVLTIPYSYNGKRIKFKYIVNSLLKYSYFVFSLEKGLDTGYKHYQLYLENDNPISFSTIKNIFPYAHIEAREGTKQQAYEYCTKSETHYKGPWEFGERPNFEEESTTPRSKRERMMQDVLEGKSDKVLMVTYPTIFSKKLVDEWRSIAGINLYQDNRNVICTYIFGSTGVGKSSYVRRKYSADQIYVVSDYERAPFDNYNGQKVIVFEEYRSNFPLSLFLQYLDIYPLLLPARYSNKQALYDSVYIISNWSLEQQYPNCNMEDRLALYRRIKYRIDITKDYCYRKEYKDLHYVGDEWCYNPLGKVYQENSLTCPIELSTYFEEE